MNETALLVGVIVFVALVGAFFLDFRSKPGLTAKRSERPAGDDNRPAPLPLARPEAEPSSIEKLPVEQGIVAEIPVEVFELEQEVSPVDVVVVEPDIEAVAVNDALEDTLAESVKTAEPEPEPEPASIFARVKQGLSRTRSSLTGGISGLLLGKKAIDEDLLEEIEEQLLMADMGVEAVSHVIDNLTAQLKSKALTDSDALYAALKEELRAIIAPCAIPIKIEKNKPYVILMVGVNGAGKTTTIGKLAKRLQNEGHSVMLAAGDTFRAAAVEQLQEWGARNDVPVIAQHTGADSASVIFDAVDSARARGVDVLIADTAGRLQNKDNLMAELTKVKRVMAKLDDSAPHEVMLVLDAGTGQNALSQAKLFNQAVGVTGISLTKLDGTAKGGVIFAVAKQMGIPIRFIGVGEKIDDLRPFDADEFVDALFDQS